MTTPQQPYGGNPYGGQPQDGNPYGQPQPQPQFQGGGNPFGQPGQQPQPGAPGAPQPSPYLGQGGGYPTPTPPPPAPRRRNVRKILGIVIPVAGLAIAGIGWLAGSGGDKEAEAAKVGECIQNTGTNTKPDIKIVECTDPAAQGKVLKRVSDTTDGDTACGSVEGATQYYYQEVGSKSFVLCLGSPK